jgi:hypothetical protein
VPQKPAPLSAFSVEQNPPYFSLCSAASDAVTHFLGVSSLNSGRSQERPFFLHKSSALPTVKARVLGGMSNLAAFAPRNRIRDEHVYP